MKQSQAQEMEKWNQQAVLMCDWMDDMDELLEGLNPKSSNKDIANIRENLKTCEVILRKKTLVIELKYLFHI